MKKLLVVQVAAWGYRWLRQEGVSSLAGLPIRSLRPVFPAVTCVAQATLRTGLPPAAHGMPANGRFFRETYQSAFWNQSARLVSGARIWEAFRARGGRVGLYFFQQSLGEQVDEVVSPAPIHTHGGGMIMATYQKPPRVLGVENPVALWRYWGPLASPSVGWDIVRVLEARLARGDAPELMIAYLPTLDYDLQRHGLDHPKARRSLALCMAQLERLIGAARAQGYAVAVSGDYAIANAEGSVVFPNRILRQQGLFATRRVRRMAYPDFFQSRALALCDHQCALIYCLDPACREQVREILEALPEVAEVRPGVGDVDWEAVGRPGCWFAWPWWERAEEAPDYASHVDIHNKPGFDPCELFFGRTPFQVSADTARVRGTHGRDEDPVAWATDLPITAAADAVAFAAALREWLST